MRLHVAGTERVGENQIYKEILILTHYSPENGEYIICSRECTESLQPSTYPLLRLSDAVSSNPPTAHKKALPKQSERLEFNRKIKSTQVLAYHFPVFFMDAHGSAGGSGSPFCNSSMEMLSGDRTKAILPSRGGRLITTPESINF